MTGRFVDQKYVRQDIPAEDIERQWHDISYMPGDRHQLDIFLPNEGQGPFPVIVDLYGGGLYRGRRGSFKLAPAMALLRQYGYAVVSPDYSLLWQADYPTQIYEVKAALRFLHAQGEQYQLDVQRMALMGESSGAQLAVTVAATENVNQMENRSFGLYSQASEKVRAVIAMYGPYEFDKFQEQFASSGVTPKFAETGTATSFEGLLFKGQAPKDVPELVQKVNPANYFAPGMPPLLAFAGKADPVVPYQQTVNMMEAARKILGPEKTPYYLVPNGVHGIKDYMLPEYTKIKAAFLKQWLN